MMACGYSPKGLPLLHGCLVFMLALVFNGCGRGKPPQGSNPASDANKSTPVVTPAPNLEVASLAELSKEYERLQTESDGKSREIADLLKRYQQKGGQLPNNLGSGLTEDQRSLLAQKIQQERLSMRNLLQDILDKDSELRQLRAQAGQMEADLPGSVTAKEGDRHDRIAMNYLVGQKGIQEKDAWRLVSQMNLQEVLAPGFRIWIYFHDGSFGTWVTQGTALISPQELQQRIRAELESQRDTALARASGLEGQIRSLEAKRSELEERVALLAQEEDAILAQTAELRASLGQAHNVTQYVVGSKRQLKASGVISDSVFGGMRLRKLSGMGPLDLGRGSEITLDASAYGLPKIKKVSLLPEVFQKGADYQISTVADGQFAKLTLLNAEKFKQFKFAIVLE